MRRWVSVLLTFMLVSVSISNHVSAAAQTTLEKYQILKDKGIFTGFSDGSARLNEEMSREQFAAVLFRLMDLKQVSGSPSYNDVLKTRWSYGYVEAATQAGLMKGLGAGKFGPTAPVTVEQLATMLVRAYGIEGSSSNGVGGKVSSWARSTVAVALDKGIIPIMYDYTGNATRALLVDATYAAYQKMAEPEYKTLKVKSLDVISNTKLVLNLDEAVSVIKPDNITIRKTYGNSKLTIRQAVLSSDGKKVEIITDPQEGSTQYTLTVDDNTKPFVSLAVDTTKPRITEFHTASNYWLSITFSEPVDLSSATDLSNYSVNNNLYLYRADLSNDGRTVTIQTSEQKSNTRYTFVAYRVADKAGNTLDPVNFSFGEDDDRSGPVVKKVTSDSNRVTIWFDERLDRGSAEDKYNYSMNGDLGYPSGVSYNDSNQSVTLTTPDQVNGKVYTISMKYIEDRFGNKINNPTKVNFTGVNDDAWMTLNVQSMRSIDWNTLEIRVDDPLTAADIAQLNVVVNRDNGNAVSMSGWQSYVTQPDSRTIRVQFRTADNGNPNLFREQHTIQASVYGLPNLNTRNQANVKSFSGTDYANPIPTIKQVKALDQRSVLVQFSEPVRNVSRDGFIIKDAKGGYVTIKSDSINNRNKVVDEAVLYLDSPTDGDVYTMTFTGAVTDAAGWNSMKVTDGSNPYSVQFRGIGDNNAAPRIASTASTDPYNITVQFSEPVRNAEKGPFTIWNEDRKALDLKDGENASFEVSEDRIKLYIHLFADKLDGLKKNDDYKLIYNTASGRIVDDQGKGYDTAQGANESSFKAKGSKHDASYIESVNAEGTKIVMTLSDPVQGYKGRTDDFEIVIHGNRVTPTAGEISKDGKTITLTVDRLDKRDHGQIRVTDQGSGYLVDVNHVGMDQEWVSFRTK
ncbi:Ig-like domain-containing protein [Paenibacillus terrigena]|uniref:Ig-like domain-containing protein n=1 Tax=Paenibacillus terrigena TaxID=369333 RepID=UPI0028D26C44|nr:Ig-like domain-containing protein [Paenibacillus terrigena]